jgi:hypothetical protein
MDIWEALQNESNQEQGLIKNSLVVIGGGGLITTEGNFLQQTTEFLVQNNKVIFWGVGSNTFEKPSYNILSHPNVILSGIRDIVYGIDIEYLPCVSCKHSVFDRNFESTDYLGAIEHPRHPIDVNNIYKITTYDFVESLIRNKTNIIPIINASCCKIKCWKNVPTSPTCSYDNFFWLL